MRARRDRSSAVAVASVLLLAAVAVRCVRGDELHCENAVAWLQRCCQGFDPDPSYCEYHDSCGVVYPTISEDDAECIVSMSCGDIAAAGICERAATAVGRTGSSPGSDLCP